MEKIVEQKKTATVEECFKAIVEVVRENLVAIYSVEETSLGIRLPNGQKFCLTLRECE